ncbi:TetR/AcrR family transcriptional regulator [Holophaga foetida]|uniref:TetR/AcrR family transcriptional regulator n=1 Tax=Holophaga foetida TaxID=35839 RepID=UPI0003102D17|nr:TetR/AcrR family transcriptional regulator [Holophaga foetida]
MPRTRTKELKARAIARPPLPGEVENPERHAHIPPRGGSRKRATQIRARETVSAILEAAACILEKDGYLAASTNAIARRAGVSIGSLYQYFSSRDDVFSALLAEHQGEVHRLVARAMERLAQKCFPPSRVLTDLLEDLLIAHAKRPDLMHAMDTELAHLLGHEAMVNEHKGAYALAQAMVPTAQRCPEEALASAWLATEITGMLGRRLAHSPPKGIAAEHIQAAFSRAMQALLE